MKYDLYPTPTPPQPVRSFDRPAVPRAVKHVRYTAAMTLCIAAQARLRDGEKVFLLCTDGRLGQGAWGTNDAASKFHALGYNFYGLMAGSWNVVRLLCRHIEQTMIRSSRPKELSELWDRVNIAASQFVASNFCPPAGIAQLLVAGFIDGEPVLLRLFLEEDRSLSLDVVQDSAVIGEGDQAADMLMKHRGYDPLSLGFERACYVVYEAKKFSESVDSVGPLTRMRIHRHIEHCGSTEHHLQNFSAEGIDKLELLRKKFFLQSIKGMDDISGAAWFNP